MILWNTWEDFMDRLAREANAAVVGHREVCSQIDIGLFFPVQIESCPIP